MFERTILELPTVYHFGYGGFLPALLRLSNLQPQAPSTSFGSACPLHLNTCYGSVSTLKLMNSNRLHLSTPTSPNALRNAGIGRTSTSLRLLCLALTITQGTEVHHALVLTLRLMLAFTFPAWEAGSKSRCIAEAREDHSKVNGHMEANSFYGSNSRLPIPKTAQDR